jgi:hypothetical protein
LVDLINYFNFSDDYSFDIVGSPSITPLNNQLLDYAAGWVMNLDVDISNWTNCQVPLNLPVVVSCETISVTYTLEGEEPVTVEVESSGEFEGKPYYEIEISGETYILEWNVLGYWKFQSEGLLSEDTPCPFGTYTIGEGSPFEAFEVNPIL